MTLLGKIEEIKEPKTNQFNLIWKCHKRNINVTTLLCHQCPLFGPLFDTFDRMMMIFRFWIFLDLGFNQIYNTVIDLSAILGQFFLYYSIGLLWSCTATIFTTQYKIPIHVTVMISSLFSLLSWSINLTILFLHFGGRNSLKNLRESFSEIFYFWSFLFE